MIKKIKRVLGYFYRIVYKERPTYFVFLICSILVTADTPFINLIVPKYIIDELMGKKDINVLLALTCTVVFGNWILKTLKSLIQTRLEKNHYYFEKYFERVLGQKCMHMDFEHTEELKVLDLNNKAQEGMGWYSGGLRGLSECFTLIVSYGITIIGVIALIASKSLLLLLIVLLTVIGSSMIVTQINKEDIKFFNQGPTFNRGFHYAFIQLTDPRFGKDIRLYDADHMMIEKASYHMDGIYHLYKNSQMAIAKWNCFNQFIYLLKNLGVYLYLGYLLTKKMIGIGGFTMLVKSANTFCESLQGVISQVQQLVKKSNFMSQYIDFMEYQDAIKHNHMEVPKMEQPVIEFRYVSFHYPRSENWILKDVNITIHSGEHLSVVGLNGAGKTTFIKLLCRMYDVTEGEIVINGKNIMEYEYDEYMKLLSVVFQDFKLFSMSVDENIRLGDFEKPEDVNMDQLCEFCGLKEKMDSLKHGLETQVMKQFDKEGFDPSGGEKQKIAIARALYKDAPVVILDEPTAALDPVAEYEIYKRFDQLVGGKTAIYISHRLSSCKFCDKIAVFSDHTIKEYGTNEELVGLANGIYAEMFAAQAQYYV